MAARSDGRIPILTYWDNVRQIGLLRSGECTMDLSSPEDSELVLDCFEAAHANGAKLFVRVNAREPSKKTRKKALERFKAKIHCAEMPAANKTMTALYQLQKEHAGGAKFGDSKWSKMLKQMLKSAQEVQAELQTPNGEGNVFGGIAIIDSAHQESAALCSLVQIFLNPVARTIFGFEVLIEKEWASMGYPFNTALGHASDNWFTSSGGSAIFVLWLDVVHQLLVLQPDLFES